MSSDRSFSFRYSHANTHGTVTPRGIHLPQPLPLKLLVTKVLLGLCLPLLNMRLDCSSFKQQRKKR